MRVTACLLVACAMFAVMSVQPAHAERSPQRRLCTGAYDVDWGREIAACTSLIESGKETPQNEVVDYVNRGNAYGRGGEFDRAIADYNEAIRLDPKKRVAYANRGVIYAAKGEFDRAIADQSEAIRLDPKDPDYAKDYANRGRAYLYSGALSKTLADLYQASELDPKYAYAALWGDIVSKRSNLPSRLADAAKQLDMTQWPAPIIRLYLGQMTFDAMLAAADDPDANKKKAQLCEAHFYGGEFALQQGRKVEAKHLLGIAAADCPKTFIEYYSAKAELKTIGAHP